MCDAFCCRLLLCTVSHQCVLCSGALLLRLLDAYAVRYGEMLDGRSEQLPTSELAGGARIRHIFQDIFVEGVGELNPSRYIFVSFAQLCHALVAVPSQCTTPQPCMSC